jgi:hypothetical protein
MSNTFSPILGIANFAMAATPVLAIVVAYIATLAH